MALPSQAEDTEREFLALVLEQTITNARIAVVGAVVVALLAWQGVGAGLSIAWWLVASAALLLRNLLLEHTRRALLDTGDKRRAGLVLNLSTAALACVLGVLPALGFPIMSMELVMVMTMFYCCWCAAATASLGTRSNRAGYLFVMMAALAIGWMRSGMPHAPYVVAALALNGLVLHQFGSRFAQRILEGIAIRAQNTELVRQLSLANEAKTRFIMAASHDLRQPLHAISFLGGVLARTRDPDDARAASQALTTAVQGLNKLFAAVLDLSRIESGVVRANLQSFRVDALLARLDAEYRAICVSSGRRWECSLESACVYSDPELLERMLRNLLDNAFKHGKGFVRLSVGGNEQAVVITVSDNGPGIAEGERERVFEEFYRVRNGPDTAGLGLGLSIVRRLVERLDCDLEIRYTEPLLQTGTTVELRLPPGDDAAPALPAAPDPAESEGPELTDLSILVIDDDASVLAATRALLIEWRCKVTAYQDPAQLYIGPGLVESPDVALIDYQLGGGVTALDVVPVIRERWPDTGIVLVTGESNGDVLKALAASGLPVLEKPVSPQELRMTLSMFRTAAE